MKIDVEGAEFLVLQGAAKTIDTQRPCVYFEANTLESSADAVRFLQQRGYATYFHRAPAFNPANFRNNAENTFGLATETNIVAIPSERVGGLTQTLDSPKIFRFSTLDELGMLILESPRHGDRTDHDRSIAGLTDELAAQWKVLQTTRTFLAGEQRALATLERHREILQAALAERDAQYEAAAKALSSRDLDLSDANEQIQQLERHVGEVGQHIKALRHEYQVALTRSAEERNAKKVLENKLHASNKERLAFKASLLGRATGSVLTAERLASPTAILNRVAKYFARRSRHARERAVIEASGLFDANLYQKHAGKVADPIGHYLTVGARRGLKPHPLFDTAYYLKRYPDVAKSVCNPFSHYLTAGGVEGRWPNAEFDGEYYLEQVPSWQSKASPLSKIS